VAAATVALAVAGGLVATRLPHAEPPPVSAAERMAALVGSARLALDDQLPKLAGRLTTGPVETEKTVTFAGLRPGGYTLAVTCAGAGTIVFDIEQTRSAAESAVYGRHTVSCAESPVVAVMTFRIRDSNPVVITATGDPRAAGNAGFALELGDGDGTANYPPGTDALHDDGAVASEESTGNANRAADLLTANQMVAPVRVTTEQMRFQLTTGYATPGDFQLRIVCAGPGTVDLTVAAVPPGGLATEDHYALTSGEIPCQEAATRLQGEEIYTLPKGTTLVLVAIPDQAARNHAGLAYEVVPA
ncbi:hypothetical protein, partial [Actinoplanes sp. NPDC026623]|uniref:hypothetical protein n=1 Tax=Actinoplanes sp. NPDC026623 TaxID=3155610 RepID=UPI0033EEE966